MKQRIEILLGLRYCAGKQHNCPSCPYCDDAYCRDKLTEDSYDLVLELLEDIDKLTKENK